MSQMSGMSQMILGSKPPPAIKKGKLPILVLYLNIAVMPSSKKREIVNEYYIMLTKKFDGVYNILVFPVSDQKTELVLMSADNVSSIKIESDLVEQLEDLINK